MKKALLLVALLIGGCCHDTIVKVPVALPCPPPPVTVRPVFAVSTVKKDAPAPEKIRALVLTIQQYDQYTRELEKILSGYRKEER